MKSSTSVRVNIVIPVYKTQLTVYEQIALTQCLRVLGQYPIILATPHALDTTAYRAIGPALQVRTFAESYFEDIQGYNRLMLSEEFYQAFSDQEYMLIYQLDAFVFRDDLPYWCQQEYDYIGAPWLRDQDVTAWSERVWFGVKQRMATWLNLKKSDGVTPREIVNLNGVGCGGFSLRRVPAMLRTLKHFQRTIADYERFTIHQYHEDVFWSIEVNRYWPRLRIPTYRKALHFAIEFYPEWAVQHYNQGQLPFGCHAWNIHGTSYWRAVFAQYGYTI